MFGGIAPSRNGRHGMSWRKLLAALSCVILLCGIALVLYGVFKVPQAVNELPAVLSKADPGQPAPPIPAEKQVPAAVIRAISVQARVPAYNATISSVVTPTDGASDGAQPRARTNRYEGNYRPGKGTSTKTTAAGEEEDVGGAAPPPRISINLDSFLQSMAVVWEDYRIEDDTINGRPQVKVTGSLGGSDIKGTAWLDAEHLYVTRVYLSKEGEREPSMKIDVDYAKWNDVFVIQQATIESGGERAVLTYSDYEAPGTVEE